MVSVGASVCLNNHSSYCGYRHRDGGTLGFTRIGDHKNDHFQFLSFSTFNWAINLISLRWANYNLLSASTSSLHDHLLRASHARACTPWRYCIQHAKIKGKCAKAYKKFAWSAVVKMRRLGDFLMINGTQRQRNATSAINVAKFGTPLWYYENCNCNKASA